MLTAPVIRVGPQGAQGIAAAPAPRSSAPEACDGGRRRRVHAQGRAVGGARGSHPPGGGCRERVVDPGLAASALSEGQSPLTQRERDVLAASANGATRDDLSRKLFLSEGTVRNYLSTAIKKLGARNRVEAAHLAERKGCLCDSAPTCSRQNLPQCLLRAFAAFSCVPGRTYE